MTKLPKASTDGNGYHRLPTTRVDSAQEAGSIFVGELGLRFTKSFRSIN